jgi:hypothetical protein
LYKKEIYASIVTLSIYIIYKVMVSENADMVIKVGAMDINVFFVPGDNDSFGDFTYIKSQIRVDSRLTGGALVDTLLHEVFHAIWAIGQLKDKGQEEERAVAVMATYMTQVIRDNPHLMRWIAKNLK